MFSFWISSHQMLEKNIYKDDTEKVRDIIIVAQMESGNHPSPVPLWLPFSFLTHFQWLTVCQSRRFVGNSKSILTSNYVSPNAFFVWLSKLTVQKCIWAGPKAFIIPRHSLYATYNSSITCHRLSLSRSLSVFLCLSLCDLSQTPILCDKFVWLSVWAGSKTIFWATAK